MTVKTPHERRLRFLGNGYFAPELPPCFSSEALAVNGAAILGAIKSLPPENGEPAYRAFVSDKATFYFPRFSNTDRLHSVINPISHLITSDVISRNWVRLRNLERKSKYSLSRSVFDWRGIRALRRPVFDRRDDFTSQLSTRFEYTVNTDIRAFYHSISSQSIPWAIHGKDAARMNSGLTQLGNELSLLIRNAQGGQTIGLPVGPDTSRVIAEVVASSIDAEIYKNLRLQKNNASRFVDDYNIGSNSISDGQRIISEIRRAINQFDLDIGKEKTTIQRTNHLTYVGWKEFLIDRLPDNNNHESLMSFLYTCHDMAKQHDNLNVDKYSMQISRRLFAQGANWRFIQEHLIASYRQNPTLIDIMVEILILRHSISGDLERDQLADFVSSRLPYLAEQQRSGEAIWLLFLCLRLNLKINATALEGHYRSSNPLLSILILQASKNGLVTGRVDQSYWDSFASVDGLRSEMWLYSYEACRRGWVKRTKADYVKKDKFYRLLSEAGISFVNLERGIGSLSEILSERKIENKLSRFQKNDDIDIDEIDIEDHDDYDFEAAEFNTY
ncbi:RNA-directed DNA polymerase [Aminobacter anthyllidis]|uniref:RNA-directed DNA polymerase n=1 Tax=Aminobacter anthyllidis TaxID=1035067 RepID=UPI0024551A4D|nr:RNA-directed DNA polymerase [Aminobacter anthyllidis]MDH4986813.1 RNA-directed DNA polymerase [Aminobacter anthyllidis]